MDMNFEDYKRQKFQALSFFDYFVNRVKKSHFLLIFMVELKSFSFAPIVSMSNYLERKMNRP